MTQQPHLKIVCLIPGGISDQILFFPTLDDLQLHYPDAEIDVIVEPKAKGTYRVCKSVSEVLTFDYKDRNGLADFGNLLGIIRDREYDIALALSHQGSISLLLWMTGIRVRIGYQGNGGTRFFTNPVPLKEQQYKAWMYHDLLQGLGIHSPCPELTLSVPKSDLQWAEGEQKRLGITESGYILIYGGSDPFDYGSGMDTLYPTNQWQTIIEDIQHKQPNLPIVMIKGLGDGEFVSTMEQIYPNLKVSSPSDIGKLAAMIGGANLMLGGDSPLLHLAVAVGTYTIALFGSTEAKKLLPPGERYMGLQSPTGRIADLKPEEILKQIWRG